VLLSNQHLGSKQHPTDRQRPALPLRVYLAACFNILISTSIQNHKHRYASLACSLAGSLPQSMSPSVFLTNLLGEAELQLPGSQRGSSCTCQPASKRNVFAACSMLVKHNGPTSLGNYHLGSKQHSGVFSCFATKILLCLCVSTWRSLP
jgi:hypothetical protein